MVWPFGPSKAKMAENAKKAENAAAAAAAELAREKQAHINAGDVLVRSDGPRWGEPSYNWYTKEQYERYKKSIENERQENLKREKQRVENERKAKIAYCQPFIDEALAKVKAGGGTRRLKRAKRKGKKTRRA